VRAQLRARREAVARRQVEIDHHGVDRREVDPGQHLGR
jgi:hypothetical protein